MNPRAKSSALWGVVGALSFLVLAQGYHLLDGPNVGFLSLLGVALLVAIAASAAAYVAAGALD